MAGIQQHDSLTYLKQELEAILPLQLKGHSLKRLHVWHDWLCVAVVVLNHEQKQHLPQGHIWPASRMSVLMARVKPRMRGCDDES